MLVRVRGRHAVWRLQEGAASAASGALPARACDAETLTLSQEDTQRLKIVPADAGVGGKRLNVVDTMFGSTDRLAQRDFSSQLFATANFAGQRPWGTVAALCDHPGIQEART